LGYAQCVALMCVCVCVCVCAYPIAAECQLTPLSMQHFLKPLLLWNQIILIEMIPQIFLLCLYGIFICIYAAQFGKLNSNSVSNSIKFQLQF